MTNAELIATIRNEIERLIEESDFDESANLYSLLSFLSTLESEKPVPKDLDEAAEAFANKHYSEWDESWDDYNGHNVEPENDKLELMDAFIAGAKWMSIHGNDMKEL